MGKVSAEDAEEAIEFAKVEAKWGPSTASAAAALGKTTVSSLSEIAMKYGKDPNVASLHKKLGSGTFVDDRSSVGVPKKATHIKTFEDRFEELKAYKAKHGHINLTSEMKEEECLHSFCRGVRCARVAPTKGKLKLTAEKIASLDSIGFSWVRHNKTFEDRFEELKAYKAMHGHINLTLKMEEEGLYSFCRDVRRARVAPEKGRFNLTTERIALLDSIGFNWVRENKKSEVSPPSKTFVDDLSSVGVPKEATHIKTFEDRFEELKAYKAKHGHINLTSKMKEEEVAGLYNFCQRMRRARAEPEKGKFNLTTERIALLDSIGFSWVREQKKTEISPKKRKNFRSRFESKVEELKAYKAEHGHFKVKKKENESLYEFCRKIRVARKTPDKSNRKLTADRIAQLDAIGFDWDKNMTSGETVAPLPLASLR